MQLTVKPDSPIPPYIQVADQLADKIRGGVLPRGSRLPSVRELTKIANISHATANKVLSHLDQKRLIERIHGKGSFSIFDAPFEQTQSQHLKKIRESFSLKRRPKEYRSLLVNLLKTTTQSCPYNLSYALLNPELVNRLIPSPFDPKLALEKIGLTRTYGDMRGMIGLRYELLELFGQGHQGNRVIITHGNQHGLHLIAETLLTPDDYILVESPTYTGAVDLFSNIKSHIIPVQLYRDGFNEEYIDRICKKYQPKLFYLTPNFSNPTGYSLSREERLSLLKLADKHGFTIVEDDPWSDISFAEKITPLGLMNLYPEKVIYLKGFSKIIGSHCRIGALFAHPEIVKQLQKTITLQSLGVSEVSQVYLLALLKQKYYHRAIPQIISELKNRATIATQELSQLLPYGVRYNLPIGGSNIWLELPPNLFSEELLLNHTYSRGITFLPGSIANATGTAGYENSFRISYSYLSTNNLRSGINQLVEITKEFIDKGCKT